MTIRRWIVLIFLVVGKWFFDLPRRREPDENALESVRLAPPDDVTGKPDRGAIQRERALEGVFFVISGFLLAALAALALVGFLFYITALTVGLLGWGAAWTDSVGRTATAAVTSVVALAIGSYVYLNVRQ